jgi:hypothetical protein
LTSPSGRAEPEESYSEEEITPWNRQNYYNIPGEECGPHFPGFLGTECP